MRVLVYGGNGQVGYCLNEEAQRRGISCLATFRPQVDVTNPESVRDVAIQFQPSVIINATAYTQVDKAESDYETALKVNRDAAANLASIASDLGVPFLHISTDYVFDGTGDGFYREEDKTNPVNAYGRSKLAGEQAVLVACERSIILRTSWVFGRHGANFVKTMLRLFQSQEELSVVGDQIGGPTFAGDIACALLDIASYLESHKDFNNWGIYNFSGSPDVSWYDFAVAIREAADKAQIKLSLKNLKKITSCDYPTPAKRPSNSRLCLDKIKLLGINPGDWQKEISENISAYLS